MKLRQSPLWRVWLNVTPPSLKTFFLSPLSCPPPGDDISGSGSGMCVGGQCSRNRPGLYAFPPENKVRAAASSQTRLCSLLLLLPLAVLLLLQRWWTAAAASNQTLKSRPWDGQKGGFGGRELELNFAKKKNNEKDLLGEWMDIFFNREEQKIKVQYSLFCFADIWICRSLGVICPCGDLLSWFQWILVMRIVGRRRRRERRERDWWWWWRWRLIDTLSGPFTTSFQSQWNSV